MSGSDDSADRRRVAQAQEDVWNERMEEYYRHVEQVEGEGLNTPIRYGVWVVVGEWLGRCRDVDAKSL